MKKSYKITTFIVACFFLLLIENQTYAAPGGYFDGKAIETNVPGVVMSVLTDNDPTTGDGLRFSPNAIFRFPEQVNIRKLFVVSDKLYTEARFYSDDGMQNLITKEKLGTLTQSEWNNFSVENVKTITLNVSTTSGYDPYVYEFDVITEQMLLYSEPVSNLSVTEITHSSVVLNWNNPDLEDLTMIRIKQNGTTIQELGNTITSFKITGLSPETEYTFEVYAIYKNDIPSVPSSIKVTTGAYQVEVENLQANASYNKVSLSWNLPNAEYFHHINIYRKQIEEQSFFQMLFSGTSVSAAETSDGFTPMFETNGTYWNDLTVQPETTYEYKLTTESITGDESEGKTITVTTLEVPLPEMEGEEINIDENGDYKVTWTSPTEGKVKILIDGNEYTVVDASLQEFTIPKEDMVYDIFGKPKVQLVAVSEDGKEGVPTKPPVQSDTGEEIQGKLPFTVNDFLKTIMFLIVLVGPFILLALAMRFAPRIIRFLRALIAKSREGRLKI